MRLALEGQQNTNHAGDATAAAQRPQRLAFTGSAGAASHPHNICSEKNTRESSTACTTFEDTGVLAIWARRETAVFDSSCLSHRKIGRPAFGNSEIPFP